MDDTTRCVGRLVSLAVYKPCAVRAQCWRFCQMQRDQADGLVSYVGIPVITNCYANGAATMFKQEPA